MKSLRIGIIGGTFDPVHNGHLRMAHEAMDRLMLDKVLFVPAFIPPHKKKGQCLFSKQVRLDLLRRVLKGTSRLIIEKHELECDHTTYSIDSIRFLKKKHGTKHSYFFLVGSDWAGRMSTWKDFQKIRSEVKVTIIPRKRGKITLEKGCHILDIPILEISSSIIREMLNEKRNVVGLIPDSIRHRLQKE